MNRPTPSVIALVPCAGLAASCAAPAFAQPAAFYHIGTPAVPLPLSRFSTVEGLSRDGAISVGRVNGGPGGSATSITWTISGGLALLPASPGIQQFSSGRAVTPGSGFVTGYHENAQLRYFAYR